MPLDQTVIKAHLDRQTVPLLFVTVSGAHLYGFESADSDYDLRGTHVTPARELFRLDPPGETIDYIDKSGFPEVDLVSHDAHKYFKLLLKHNGYVLEQVFSPLVVHAMPEFEELKTLARGCITKHVRYHFFNFAANQWQTVVKSGKPTTKGLLYTYRVLMAGIHIMRTGQVESNLRVLNEHFRLSYIDELIVAKVGGTEKAQAMGLDLPAAEREFERLSALLDAERDRSSLPDEPSSRAGLNDLLVRLRLKTV